YSSVAYTFDPSRVDTTPYGSSKTGMVLRTLPLSASKITTTSSAYAVAVTECEAPRKETPSVFLPTATSRKTLLKATSMMLTVPLSRLAVASRVPSAETSSRLLDAPAEATVETKKTTAPRTNGRQICFIYDFSWNCAPVADFANA